MKLGVDRWSHSRCRGEDAATVGNAAGEDAECGALLAEVEGHTTA